MKSKILMAALAMSVAVPTAVPAPAFAKNHSYDRYDRHGNRVYHGRNRSYRHRCGGGNGAVGTIAGGAGGALIGNGLGGGTLGTIAGGVGGALLGRHLDKKNTRHRNGC